MPVIIKDFFFPHRITSDFKMAIDRLNTVEDTNDFIFWKVGKYFRDESFDEIRSVEFEHGGTSWYFSVRTEARDSGSPCRVFTLHHSRSVSQKDSQYFITLVLDRSFKNMESYCTCTSYATGANLMIFCKPSHQKCFHNATLFAKIESEPSDGSKKADSSLGMAKLAADFEDLLISKENCDVVLKVGDREFQAHRVILQARSPVFSAMFKHDTVERQSGVVDVEDCDPDAFQDFLHYIYTGKLKNLSSQTVRHMYTAADKYKLLELKLECLKYMKGNVSVENCSDVLSLALQYDETELKDIATDFFLANATSIVVTPQWQTFLAINLVAGNELIVKLSETNSAGSSKFFSVVKTLWNFLKQLML